MFEKLNNWKIASLIFLVLTIIFCYPVYSVMTNWGIHDWDQHLFYEGAARISLTQYHQFPLWNPWQCGGNVLLANPQSPFLSLHFPITLLLGEVIATKLAIVLYLFIGFIGMWFVGKQLNLKGVSIYFPAIILMLSGIYAVRMTVGHTNWYHLAWIPWMFLFYLKAKEKIRYIFPASLFLALMFLGGGIHVFMIASVILGIHAFFSAIQEKNWKLLLPMILIGLLSIPISAVKFVPMISVYDEMLPLSQSDIQPNSVSLLFHAMTERNPDLTEVYYAEDFPWYLHEYYAYVGILVLALFFISLFFAKEYWVYPVSGLCIFMIILVEQYLPSTFFFHGPSRFMFAAVFFIALAVGFFINKIQQKNLNWEYAVLVLLLLITIDLVLVNSPLLAKAFTVEPIETQQTSYFTVYAENDMQNYMQYASLLSNIDMLNCYERYHVQSTVIPKMSTQGTQYGNYHGEAYLNSSEQQEITFFSPNKIIVHSQPGLLIINQNYISGWKAKINNEHVEVINTDGLISVSVNQESNVEFYYLPTAFIIGLIITIISLLSWIFVLFRTK